MQEYARIVKQILAALPERDRQALVRFYVRGEPAEVICKALGLTEAEFRVVKLRAKGSFRALAREGTK